MIPSRRPFMVDEELGKKDDDHRPEVDRPQWRPRQWKLPRPRRLLLGIVALYLLYLFFKHMPTDLPPATQRFNPALTEARLRAGAVWSNPAQSPGMPPQSPPPRDDTMISDQENKNEYYDGDVKLYSLTSSLSRFRKVPSQYKSIPSHAVVFVGASLQSVSDLLPLACQMAAYKRNEVHLVLMGREGVSIEGIQRVNGVDDKGCPIFWHDGRPDYAQWSTEARMERAAVAGLDYVHAYLRPQAMITQGEQREKMELIRAVQSVAQRNGAQHIALPAQSRDIMWMSALDSNALRAWNDFHIEILVQAPSESAGSLIRLIRSLERADYLGTVPSLTVELPYHTDSQLLHFLQRMSWPPHAASKVTLRRRLPSGALSHAEESAKFVENFYPKDPNATHLLVLSPQTELAPSFFHYLKYLTLNYKHSAGTNKPTPELFGISLELPSSTLAGDKPFSLPENALKGESELPMFLWQAPNSNAALYFGDKWTELYSFLSRRLTAGDTKASGETVSNQYPAVLEYMLELMRAQNSFLAYPAFPLRGNPPLATVHSELRHTSEESASHDLGKREEAAASDHIDELVDRLESAEKPPSSAPNLMPLLDQFAWRLPDLEDLPTVSYNGDASSAVDLAQQAREYRERFRASHGGCHDEPQEDETSPESLFCLGN